MSRRGIVAALAGVTAVAVAASALVAFATIHPPPLPVKQKKVHVAAAPAEPKSPPTVAAAPPAPPPKPPAPAPSAVPSDEAQRAALDELRRRANDKDVAAMEELGRRLLQGTDAPKDPQAGAGWLMRAAALGSVQSAFNVGVMYERGFVLERDSSKAVEWYRKAADAGLPTAKHNLALLLRDGKGTARDVKAAMQLLLSAARQGMAASMFTLGDIYEQGDSGTRDAPAALAWFAITGEFERQANRGTETPLAKTAGQRAQVLKRTLSTAELERAQELAQGEFRRIIAELSPQPSPPRSPPPAPAATAAPATSPAPVTDATLSWPKGASDQIRAIQQALFDLKRLRDKPDGTLGPNTRAAIREFQKSMDLKQTGEPSRDLYVALVASRNDIVRQSPLPTPPVQQAATAPPEPAKVEPPAPAPLPAPATVPAPAPAPKIDDSKIDLGKAVPPPAPPTSSDIAREARKADPPKPAPVVVDTTKPAPAKIVEAAGPQPSTVSIPATPVPPPPTSADIARADPNAWPASRVDQVKAVQTLLRDLRFYTKAIDGQASGGTQAAIRDFQRMSGLKETGEIDRSLFESLKEMRKLMAPAQN